MTGVDLAILGVLLISMLVSLVRGFIRETFSLVVWIAAAVAGFRLSGALSGWLVDWVTLPSVRVLLAFAAVFVLVLIVGGLVGFLLGKLVEKTGLSPTDRMLGALFGLSRGVLIVVVAVMLARFTPFPEDPWWDESRLLPQFERMAERAGRLLPTPLQDLLIDPGVSVPVAPVAQLSAGGG